MAIEFILLATTYNIRQQWCKIEYQLLLYSWRHSCHCLDQEVGRVCIVSSTALQSSHACVALDYVQLWFCANRVQMRAPSRERGFCLQSAEWLYIDPFDRKARYHQTPHSHFSCVLVFCSSPWLFTSTAWLTTTVNEDNSGFWRRPCATKSLQCKWNCT